MCVDKAMKVIEVGRDIDALLATNPPSPARFSGHVLICYWLDPPDPGSINVACEHCDKPQVLGPKSAKLRGDNPGRFHTMCVVCGVAVTRIRAELGESVKTRHPDDWPQ